MAKTKPLEEQTPEELRSYIGELREESKARREALSVYDDVFGKFSERNRAGLLQMMRVFGENEREGARLMADLSQHYLDDTTPEKEELPMPETKSDTTDNEDPFAEAPAWAKALIEKVDSFESQITGISKRDEQSAIEEIKADARALGYEENSEGWKRLFGYAANNFAGDLNQADEWLRHKNPDLAPATDTEAEPDAEPETDEEDPSEESEVETAAKGRFAKTAKAGGAGAPKAKDTKGDGIDFSNKNAVHDAALAALSAAGSGQTKAP